MDIDAVNARLQRLEDLEAIRQLFVDYGHHLDFGDFAAFASLFAREGEILLGPMGRAKGPEAIQALMERALGGTQGSSYHVVCNPIIHLDGDTATTDVTWIVVKKDAAGNPVLPSMGRHRDTVVREDGRWKFQRRAGYIDIPSR